MEARFRRAPSPPLEFPEIPRRFSCHQRTRSIPITMACPRQHNHVSLKCPVPTLGARESSTRTCTRLAHCLSRSPALPLSLPLDCHALPSPALASITGVRKLCMNSRLHHPLDSVGSTCKLCSLYAVCVALYRCAEVVKDVLEAPPFA